MLAPRTADTAVGTVRERFRGQRVSGPTDVALIGCGRVVEDHHAAVYRDPASGVRAVALADASAERRRVLGELVGIPKARRFASHADLLAAGGPSVAVVATPSRTHGPIVADLLARRRSVVCEKPLSPFASECAALLNAARLARAGLATMHNYTMASTWRRVYETVAAGAVGRPLEFRANTADDGPLPGAPEAEPMWRLDPARAGGGCLLDSGYHYVYLAELLLSAPVTCVRAADVRTTAKLGVEEFAHVQLDHAYGATSELSVSWAASGHSPPEHTIVGLRGRIRIDEDESLVEVSDAAGTRRIDCDGDAEGFRDALPRAVRAVTDGHEATALAVAGTRVVRILSACYRSASSGLPVTVE